MGEARSEVIFDGHPRDQLAALYVDHFVRLAGLAHWLVGDRSLAEELVQETFVRLIENPPRLQDPAALEAYVRSALVNRSRSKLRRLMIERRHAKAEAHLSHDVLPDQHVRDAVLTLPMRQRQCVVLRFYADQTVPEIAKTLGVTAGSVKTHLHRGLRSLADHIGEASREEELT